ncbi:two-component system sensor histidine kinase PhoQ [Pseudomaricurvus hydrocarbonicus]
MSTGKKYRPGLDPSSENEPSSDHEPNSDNEPSTDTASSSGKDASQPSSKANVTNVLNSLQGRFIAASLLCLPLFIGASGLLLERAFKDSLVTAEQEQLQSQLYILLGAAELQQGQLWLPEQLYEPRYNVVDSGLYATVSTPSNFETGSISSWKQLWQSESVSILNISLPYNAMNFQTDQRAMESVGNYFRLTYDLSWVEEDNSTLPLRFQIYHDRQTYKQQVKKYRQQLWYGLSFLAMGLLTVQVLIMRWGLRPLKKLATDLKRLLSGNQSQLMGNYPDEITPVTDSLNEVLRNEQQQRERYRNTLGDLAHSLKTPLAVIQGELQRGEATRSSTAQKDQSQARQTEHHDRQQTSKHADQQGPAEQAQSGFIDTEVVNEQLERMGTIIRHQLQRAVLQTNQKRHSQQAIRPIVQRLCNVMGKVYQEKNIEFTIAIDESLSYPIESQDLFELLGNLIENACKYGRNQVMVSATTETPDCVFTVADNGPGISDKQAQTILQRGARADTAQPGQGIGLAVSTDIISAYGGSIEARNSSLLGGAEFQIRLPTVR